MRNVAGETDWDAAKPPHPEIRARSRSPEMFRIQQYRIAEVYFRNPKGRQ